MTNYYVRKTGLDTNNGTSGSTAFLTINKALTTSANGDTIYVGAGTYSDLIQNVTKTDITITGDTTGVNTGDSGLVIINQASSQFSACSGTNFTVKNIISCSSSYALYVRNDTAKFINCVFAGINGGSCSGASYSGYMYNCVVVGNYAFANNMGAPQKVANSILIGTCESGMNVNFQNCYTLSAGTDVFISKSSNNYRVSSTYEINVKNTGVYITGVPTTDIIGTARQTPPWIGVYDVLISNYPPTLNSPLKTFINNNLQMQLSATSVSDPDGNTVKYQVSIKKPDNSVVIKRAYDSSFQTSPFTFSTITFDASEFDVGTNTIIVDVIDNQSPAGTYQWSTTLTKTNTLKLLIQDGVKWKYINGGNLVSALTNYTTAIDSDKVNAFLSFGMGNNLSSIASAMNQVENSTVSVVVYKFGLLS